jgi:hypothetical protein
MEITVMMTAGILTPAMMTANNPVMLIPVAMIPVR